MFAWIDGHVVLVAIAAPTVSYLAVGLFNGWQRIRPDHTQGPR